LSGSAKVGVADACATIRIRRRAETGRRLLPPWGLPGGLGAGHVVGYWVIGLLFERVGEFTE
jgi:hypothetical protein